MADAPREHTVLVTADDVQIEQWVEYEFSISMVEPADTFTMSRPLTDRAWRTLRPDTEIKIFIDGACQLNGYIDDAERGSKDLVMRIEGRDKGGRLVQESIPTTSGFDGLTLVDAVTKLVKPWFPKVVTTDARNRTVRRGKGGKAPANGEPAIFNVKGKLDEDHSGRVEPGEMRWNMIEQLCSSVSLLGWSSGDGREFIIGAPNYKQEVQYLFQRSKTRGSNVEDIRERFSVRDRYAKIEAHGSGAGDDVDFGDATISKLGEAFDGPNADGTGRDFKHPKRLALTHRALADNAEGARAAQREMNRRNFSRRQLTIDAPLHGQLYRSSVLTLFAPNTLARVIDDEKEIDDVFLIYALTFRGSRQNGETTQIKLVPRGTVFIA